MVNVGLTPSVCCQASPVAETGFSHRITAYKSVGHFFGLSYWKISGSNQIKNSVVFLESVTCSGLRGRTIIKKLWTFFGPWGRDRSMSPPCWIFRVKQIHPSTASERTTRQLSGYEAHITVVRKQTAVTVYLKISSYCCFPSLRRLGLHSAELMPLSPWQHYAQWA